MLMLPLSPEICRNIALVLSTGESSRRDLNALCLTCKPFQHEATPYLYEHLTFSDPVTCLLACKTIMLEPRLGLHTRSFAFNPYPRVTDVNVIPRAFWEAIQSALHMMHNLDILVLSDFCFANSWILDSEQSESGNQIAFQLKNAHLRISCDAYLLRFLNTQNSLRSLQLYGGVDESEASTPPIIPPLPSLQSFEGPLLFGSRLLIGCSTTAQVRQVQLVVDCERTSAVPILSGVAEALRGTLQNVNILDLHGEDTGIDVLALFANSGASLKHIGTLPYPITGRHRFHKHLITLTPTLRSIDLDLTRWNPAPTPSAAQRVLADELRTYCPSLRVIVFWIAGARVRWTIHSNGTNVGGNGGLDQWATRVDGDLGQGEAWS